jgi:uncharacterized repeat protein (TIGR01451 family)
LIQVAHRYLANKAISRLNLQLAKGLMLLSILVSILQSTPVNAGTTVSLNKSYAGNMSYVLAGASFRNSENNTCSYNNSASGTLSGLPSTATVVAAYIYWAGSYSNIQNVNNADIYLDSTRLTVQHQYTEDFFFNNTTFDFYSGRADITALVQSKRNASYTMTGLHIETNPHCNVAVLLGGWAMVVIYEDDSEPTRVVNLYEGFQQFRGSAFNIIANNFEVSGTPSGKHAHITWEGDVANSSASGGFNESLIMTTSSGSRELTDSVNLSGEQFNSRSNIYGASAPTYGLDIDMYDISSYLTPGDTSFQTQYSSGGDLVLLSAEITSVSNVSVADLAVTTSNPTGWQANSTVTKKFTISNNGPDDIPTQSVRFSTTLPSALTFNGTQGDSDWLCSQTGQTLECIYQSKLRSGWSDYLDLTFDVGSVAGTNVSMSVNVDHNTAPYDIFDNHIPNNTYNMTVPVATDPVIDLSASSKVPNNLNGDLLLAGDTLQYTITIDDASNLAVTNIHVTDDLPANISAYRITSLPSGATNNSTASGGVNNTGFLDIQNISLAAGATAQIVIEVDINTNAPDGATLQNQATITQGSDIWIVDTGDITVVEPDLSASGKDAADVNGGWLLPGETVRYTITLDDNKDLDLTGLRVTDHLPANISSFTVSNLPPGAQDFSVIGGGNNNTGYIDIRNISLNSGDTLDFYVDAIVDVDAPDTANLTNTATVSLNNANWDTTSNELKVSLTISTPASGNKPLYLVNNNLTRNLPSANTSSSFNHGTTLTWTIDNNLQSDLTLTAGDIRTNLAIEGHRTGSISSLLSVALYYNDNVGGGEVNISSKDIPYGNYRINTIYDTPVNLPLASDLTIPTGSSIYLKILNTSENNTVNQYGELDIHSINGAFYSAVVLNSSTVINVDTIRVWDATYGVSTGTGDGNLLPNSLPDSKLYIRAVISDPFGAFDINRADINILKADGITSYDFTGHPDGNTNSMNQVDDIANDLSTHTKTFEKEITLLESNESIGYWTITIKGYEGLELAPNQVTHESVLSYQIKPFLPAITLTKTIAVINDPINGSIDDGANPKAIPGAELLYTINAINSGRGQSDDGSLILQDEIPVNSNLYIGTITCSGTDQGPVCFKEGTTPHESGLEFIYTSLTDNSDDLFFSTDGSDFTYAPVNSGDGYDPAIRYIRMAPANALNNAPKDASAQPEFNFYYKIRLD